VLTRAERKLAEIQKWIDSVGSIADWPAAIALAWFRTRPAHAPAQIWVRPRRLNGLSVRVDPANESHVAIYEEIFIDGLYDLGLVAFVPDAIIDCGAFEGHFSLLAHARFPLAPVITFEPNARNYQGLLANVQKNHLAIDTREAAVSTADGTAEFSGDGCGGRLGGGGAAAVTVRLRDLLSVVADLRSQRLLLKLDVEGEESTLLPALLPVVPRCCAIFFEWHHGPETLQRVTALLAEHGFTSSVTRINQVDDAVFIDAFAQRI
jgi:FkbM family methyltransferase